MIAIGEYNTLEILRETSVGLFLGDTEDNDILLPNKYVPETYEIGDMITVFCYLDYDERPIATDIKPAIKVNEFAVLKVSDVSSFGAFLEWGLEKHLFVPFKEQQDEMIAGNKYLVYCYLDAQTNRLVASSKVKKYLNNENLSISQFEKVDLIVARKSDLGYEVVINEAHYGLIYNNEIFKELHIGDKHTGFVKKIREDYKIDVSLQDLGYKNIEPTAEGILEILKKNDGFIAVTDKSSPEAIKTTFGISKKSFKRAVGTLYKQRLISLEEKGIQLLIKE